MLHKDSTVVNGNHYIHAWEVANTAARIALVPVVADEGKVCKQLDTKVQYLLENSVGPVWRPLGVPVPTTTDALAEGAVNLYGTPTRIRTTVLTGLSTAIPTPVTAAHTILEAIGFLQKQLDNAVARSIQVIPIAASDEVTALTIGANKVTFRMPFTMLLSAVRASLSTAQATGAIFTVDIQEAGVTILSTKLTIDNTEKSSVTALAPSVISDTTLTSDNEITINIDQIGDGTAKGLKIYLIGTVL